MLGLGNISFLALLLWGALLCSSSCSFQVAVRMRKVGCSLRQPFQQPQLLVCHNGGSSEPIPNPCFEGNLSTAES